LGKLTAGVLFTMVLFSGGGVELQAKNKSGQRKINFFIYAKILNL
jgi:hypothetical protein